MSGPITAQTPVRLAAPLPEACDVVVIGGGVIGVFTALYLARAGVKVVLCEKGRIAGEQSSRNWGWLRQLGRDPQELPIMTEALALWREADADTGGRCGVRQTGVVYLARSAREMARISAWLPVARDHGLRVDQLDAAQTDAMIAPHGGGGWTGALVCPDDGRAEPWDAVPAVAGLARSEGVVIRENCAVRALDVTAGALRGVITEDGPVRCARAVLAGGAWSSLFARRHGVSLPQLSVRSTVACTAPLPGFFDGSAADEDLAFRRRLDGGYSLALSDASEHFIGPDSFRALRLFAPLFRKTLRHTRLRAAAPRGFPDAWGTARRWPGDAPSPFERMRVLDPAPDARALARMQTLFAQRFPALGRPVLRHGWAGMIDVMPDLVPVLDQAPTLSGLTIATGMCGHGFGIGPGIGRIAAQLVRGQATGHDISGFRLARFDAPRQLRIGPNI